MALHDPEFNGRWIHSWPNQLDIIRSQVRASISNHVVSPRVRSSEMPSLTFRFPSFLHS
jgi:hypothetical protein